MTSPVDPFEIPDAALLSAAASGTLDFMGARRTAVVVGGGPSGLISAEVLATAGFHVDLYEHMPSVGRKLLLAGRSGLNMTNNEPLDQMMERFGDVALVRDAVRRHPPTDLRNWAAGLDQPTYVGSSGKVFPTAFRATPLLRSWLARLRNLGVDIHVRHRWLGWAMTDDGVIDPSAHRFQTADGTPFNVRGDVTVFALGGASWPRVGADGGWAAVFAAAGLDVRSLRPANCGLHVNWSQVFAGRYTGVPVKNTRVSVGTTTERGDIMITDRGLESGPIYMVSSVVRDAIDREGRCTILIDLHPDLTVDTIAARLSGRRTKDSVTNSLRRSLGLSPVAIALLREATGNDLPSDGVALAQLIKAVPLTIESVAPIERAISTAGGLALHELDDQFMVRSLPGTFAAGEMLDWEAPTGGYLLQASFSTGVAAARGAIAWSDSSLTHDDS